jgi:site-specific recombinase XerD
MDALFVAAGLNSKGTRRRDRITLHSLRHTFASWLAIAGLPLRGIQELLGHKSILTTERYSHLGGNGIARITQSSQKGSIAKFIFEPFSAWPNVAKPL